MAQLIFHYINENLAAAILGFFLATSELLAQIPSIAANSVFQLISGWVKKAKELLFPPA